MNKLRIFAIILVFVLFVVGCKEVHEVTHQQLMERTKEWKEPKVAIWYYVGSDDEYHYFYFQDLKLNEKYKVSKKEMDIQDYFSLTKNRSKWKVMPWGVIASMDKKITQFPVWTDKTPPPQNYPAPNGFSITPYEAFEIVKKEPWLLSLKHIWHIYADFRYYYIHDSFLGSSLNKAVRQGVKIDGQTGEIIRKKP